MHARMSLPRPGRARLGPLQGYLTYKKTHPPRTLPYVYTQGSMGGLDPGFYGGARGMDMLLWARCPCRSTVFGVQG